MNPYLRQQFRRVNSIQRQLQAQLRMMSITPFLCLLILSIIDAPLVDALFCHLSGKLFFSLSLALNASGYVFTLRVANFRRRTFSIADQRGILNGSPQFDEVIGTEIKRATRGLLAPTLLAFSSVLALMLGMLIRPS